MKALRALHASGVDVPSVANEPIILPPYRWVWDAFCVLSAKRLRIDGTPQPIQLTEIKGFVDFFGIDEEVRRGLFFDVVSTLDSIYMQDYWEKLRIEQERSKRARR